MTNTDPESEFTLEQKAKAQRVIMIIYIVMTVLVVLPFVVLFWMKGY